MVKFNEEIFSRIDGFFDVFNKDDLGLIDAYYDENVRFKEPVGGLPNRDKLKYHYKNLFKQIDSMEFKLLYQIKQGTLQKIFWTMILKSPEVNCGEQTEFLGASIVEFGGLLGKIIEHRDYLIMDGQIYESNPLIGGAIGIVKREL